MALKKYDIYERENGSLGDEEWTLIVDPQTGRQSVRYSWSWGNPYKGQVEQGSRTMSVEDFLKDDGSDFTAKSRLEELLERKGLNR